ncbi:MAG TPA: hypothetical protein VLE73_01505 [Candidatus Saccharimonadales bacterium]|nr:hypothetical protein [Candidatus Saccharimonadales bacterium]
MRSLRLLRTHNIPYAIYSGGHVAYLLDEKRPVGDADALIDAHNFPRAHKILGGVAYNMRPLIWPDDMPHESVSFLLRGDLEVKAGSDGEPGYFTYTDLVKKHSTMKGDNGYTINFVCPTETILFKAAMWRSKDQEDIAMLARQRDNNGRQTINIDGAYLEARLEEVRLDSVALGRLAVVRKCFQEI